MGHLSAGAKFALEKQPFFSCHFVIKHQSTLRGPVQRSLERRTMEQIETLKVLVHNSCLFLNLK